MSWEPFFFVAKKHHQKTRKALKQAEMAELQKEVQAVVFLVVAKGSFLAD